MNNPRYIVFRNADEDPTSVSAVWWIGQASHATMWKHLRQKDSQVFGQPLSAGMALFDVKTKKFRAYDYSVSLNLVSHEDDSKILTATLTDNRKLVTVMSDMGQAPDFSIVMGSSEFLQPEQLHCGNIYVVGKATFRVHDSTRPYKLEFPEAVNDMVGPGFVEYLEERLFA